VLHFEPPQCLKKPKQRYKQPASLRSAVILQLRAVTVLMVFIFTAPSYDTQDPNAESKDAKKNRQDANIKEREECSQC
jgi:hypothetical protein